MSFWKKAKASMTLLAAQLSAKPASPGVDDDAAAATYTKSTPQLAEAGSRLIDAIPIGLNQKVLDAPTGPATHAGRLAQLVGPNGRVLGVDISQRMVAQAQTKLGHLPNIQFHCGDILETLRQQPRHSFDGFFCGFGYCYLQHHSLLEQAVRVLRPGGWIGIIENKQNTLADVNHVFWKTLLEHPSALAKKVCIQMPIDSTDLAGELSQWGFEVSLAYDCHCTVPCVDGQELVSYLTKGGVGAGYLDALKPEFRVEFLNALSRNWDCGDSRNVRHEYCAVVGTLQTDRRWMRSFFRSFGAWSI